MFGHAIENVDIRECMLRQVRLRNFPNGKRSIQSGISAVQITNAIHGIKLPKQTKFIEQRTSRCQNIHAPNIQKIDLKKVMQTLAHPDRLKFLIALTATNPITNHIHHRSSPVSSACLKQLIENQIIQVIQYEDTLQPNTALLFVKEEASESHDERLRVICWTYTLNDFLHEYQSEHREDSAKKVLLEAQRMFQMHDRVVWLSLDLKCSFFQIPLEDDFADSTAQQPKFIVKTEVDGRTVWLRLKRLPMGCRTSAEIVQIVTQHLAGTEGSDSESAPVVHVDNIVLFALPDECEKFWHKCMVTSAMVRATWGEQATNDQELATRLGISFLPHKKILGFVFHDDGRISIPKKKRQKIHDQCEIMLKKSTTTIRSVVEVSSRLFWFAAAMWRDIQIQERYFYGELGNLFHTLIETPNTQTVAAVPLPFAEGPWNQPYAKSPEQILVSRTIKINCRELCALWILLQFFPTSEEQENAIHYEIDWFTIGFPKRKNFSSTPRTLTLTHTIGSGSSNTFGKTFRPRTSWIACKYGTDWS